MRLNFPSCRMAAIKLRNQMPGEVSGIVSGSENLLGLSASHEWQSHDVKAGCVHDTTIVAQAPAPIEDR
jgi:hypothetical protein